MVVDWRERKQGGVGVMVGKSAAWCRCGCGCGGSVRMLVSMEVKRDENEYKKGEE